MQLQSKNINKVRSLLYAILKYSFKQYFKFCSVFLFCIWGGNIFAWVDSIPSVINGQYIPTKNTKVTHNTSEFFSSGDINQPHKLNKIISSARADAGASYSISAPIIPPDDAEYVEKPKKEDRRK